jgi:hypothetical protein
MVQSRKRRRRSIVIAVTAGIAATLALVLLTALPMNAQSSRHITWEEPVTSSVSPSPTPSVSRTASSPSPDASATPTRKARPKRLFGVYGAMWPSTPEGSEELRWASQAGFDVLHNYSAIDGTTEDIERYLDEAVRLKLQIVVSLKDLYDGMPQNEETAGFRQQFGKTPEAQAIGFVRRFSKHPGVWGFNITDERPESPADVSEWKPLLDQRAKELRKLTDKPVMITLVGWTADSTSARRLFCRQLMTAADHLALDYYPYPENEIYGPTSHITDISRDLRAIADDNGWFVVQAFAWGKDHPEGRPLGFSTTAPAPDTHEMVKMGKLALQGGAQHLMFYSYMDNVDDPQQLAAIKAAVTQLRKS